MALFDGMLLSSDVFSLGSSSLTVFFFFFFLSFAGPSIGNILLNWWFPVDRLVIVCFLLTALIRYSELVIM
jgi:hypothetical protein